MNPKVSVIIPNYNHAPYLKQRIDSVLNQTFQDFEVIILDDCSTDNSWEVIKDYENHPNIIHIERNKVNSGSPFMQWTKGIELTKGEWIWIAESDDWAESNLLETLINEIGENPQVPLFHVQSYTHFSPTETIIKKHFEITGVYNFNDYSRTFFKYNLFPNASAVLFKKSAVDSSIFHKLKKFRFAGDWLFWIHLCINHKFGYVSTPLNHFRKHGDSVTTKFETSDQFEKEKKWIQNYLILKGPFPLKTKLKRYIETLLDN